MKKVTKALLTFAALAIMTMAMSTGVFATEATVNVPKVYYGTEKAVTKTYTYTNDAKYKLSILLLK